MSTGQILSIISFVLSLIAVIINMYIGPPNDYKWRREKREKLIKEVYGDRNDGQDQSKQSDKSRNMPSKWNSYFITNIV